MAVWVGKRQVFVQIGRTEPPAYSVWICTEANLRGDYDWVIRVMPPAVVTKQEVMKRRTLPELIRWLTEDLGGVIERQPPAAAA